MKAHLKPLSGKYYGTEIEVTEGPLAGLTINLWKSTGTPSDRELANHGMSREFYDMNLLIADLDNWTPHELVIADSHYESREIHELALKLVEFLENESL